ncbi:hypothetical protein Bca4012_054543 [Brassica carinata]
MDHYPQLHSRDKINPIEKAHYIDFSLSFEKNLSSTCVQYVKRLLTRVITSCITKLGLCASSRAAATDG